MANVLVQGGFQGGFDPSRQGALGTDDADNITLPAPLFDTTGTTQISPTEAGGTLEILLLGDNDILAPDLVVFPDNTSLVVNGNTGDDVITGAADEDTLFGGQGSDVLQGGDENDQLFGNLGNDGFLDGGLGDDSVFGGQGDDFVAGGDGRDAVFGDLGNDFVRGDAGIDTLTGGSGADTFSINPNNEVATFDLAFADRITDFSNNPAVGADRIDIVGVAIPPVLGVDVTVGSLTNVGGVNGFGIFEAAFDLNGNGIFGEAVAFVVNNPNIISPISSSDFI
ncbi:MAG: calcium-binding protein [Microcoleaceae cyanobacterium]